MIRVVVRDDDRADRFVGNFSDRIHQGLPQCGRAECINDDYAPFRVGPIGVTRFDKILLAVLGGRRLRF